MGKKPQEVCCASDTQKEAVPTSRNSVQLARQPNLIKHLRATAHLPSPVDNQPANLCISDTKKKDCSWLSDRCFETHELVGEL